MGGLVLLFVLVLGGCVTAQTAEVVDGCVKFGGSQLSDDKMLQFLVSNRYLLLAIPDKVFR